MSADELLSYRQIAALAGVAPGTVRNYRRRGYMPPPDVMLADRPRWRRETIEQWLDDRPSNTWIRRRREWEERS